MTSRVNEFIRRVRKHLDVDDPAGPDMTLVHQEIEVAYDTCIVAPGITKATFMTNLLREDAEIAAMTMEHLFTPINWSRVRLRTLWGVKNTATGNMLTLERDSDRDLFVLKESTEDERRLDFAPMLSGSEEDARLFITMLQEVPIDAPLGPDETMVRLELGERVNVANLEPAEVKVIF